MSSKKKSQYYQYRFQLGLDNSLEGRNLEAKSKYFLDFGQTHPMRVLYGKDEVPLDLLMPMFDYSTKKEKSKYSGSKSKGAGGAVEVYYATVVASLCVGEIDYVSNLHSSDNQDEDEQSIPSGDEGYQYPGYSMADSDDGTDVKNGTFCDFGNVKGRFHRGTMEQIIDPVFYDKQGNLREVVIDKEADPPVTLGGDHAAEPWIPYRGISYFAGSDFKLGKSKTTPNYLAELIVFPKQLAKDIDGMSGISIPPTWDELPYQKINDVIVCDLQFDTYAPLVVYEYLRNETWGGANLSKDDIDIQSFIAATDICINEGISISPCIDSDVSIREAISDLLEYVDGMLYLNDDGKVAIKLIRYDSSTTYPEISADNLCEEPEVNWKRESDTWGVTIVKFNSRPDKYEETSEVFNSPRYVDKPLGEIRSNEVSIPFVKQRLVAAKLARRIGNEGAMQPCEVSMEVAPGNYHVGDIVKLNYPKFGINGLLLRITKVSVTSQKSPSVKIEAIRQTDLNWNVEVNTNSLSSGFSSTVRTVVYTPAGFLRPYVISQAPYNVHNINSNSRAVIFCEQNTTVDIDGYVVGVGLRDIGNPSIIGFYSQGDDAPYNYYQTKVELVKFTACNTVDPEGHPTGPRLLLKLRIDGNNRYQSITDILRSANVNEAYLTVVGYNYYGEDTSADKDIFFGNDPNNPFVPHSPIRPMTFQLFPNHYWVDEIKDGNNEYIIHNGYVDTKEDDRYRTITIVAVAVTWLDGCVFPDTVTTGNKYYPSSVGFVYVKSYKNDLTYQNDTESIMPIRISKYQSEHPEINFDGNYELRLPARLSDGSIETNGVIITGDHYIDDVNNNYCGLYQQNVEQGTLYHQRVKIGAKHPEGEGHEDEWENEFDENAWGLPINFTQFTGCNVTSIRCKTQNTGVVELADDSEILINAYESEYIPYDLLPVGTSPGTVAAGDHTHRYYSNYEDSTTIAHQRGKFGTLIVYLDDNTLSLTMPETNEADLGDEIEFIPISRVQSAYYFTVTIPDETEDEENDEREIRVGSGTVLRMVCTGTEDSKTWTEILTPKYVLN